ncbi:MAG: DUF63 family protein [Thermoplasmatota archaeon]
MDDAPAPAAPATEAEPDTSMGARFSSLYTRRKALVWALAILMPIAVVGVGVAVAPSVFYDHYIWEDLYGPLWADAHQAGPSYAPQYQSQCLADPTGPHCVLAKDGYTLKSEATYGIILAVALSAIYVEIFRRWNVKADGWFVFALTPYIVLGPLARSLEDANVFCKAGTANGGTCDPGVFSYLYISPLEYIHIAVYTVAFLLLGILVERTRGKVAWQSHAALIGAVLGGEFAFFLGVVAFYSYGFTALPPIWVVGAACAAGFGIFVWLARNGRAGTNATLFVLGLPLAVPAAWLVLAWTLGGVWSPVACSGRAGCQIFPQAGATMLGLAVLTTLIVVGIMFALKRRYAYAASFLAGMNVAMVFGHMVDGFATWIALTDPFHFGIPNYGEKHPVSDVLLSVGAGTPFSGLLFPIAKLAMVLVVVYLLDQEFEDQRPEDKQLVGLIKMAVFILGFAPGSRDLLRVTMGV